MPSSMLFVDPDLFAAFRSFLREFDIPCLVMTATLPPVRRHNFEELGFNWGGTGQCGGEG